MFLKLYRISESACKYSKICSRARWRCPNVIINTRSHAGKLFRWCAEMLVAICFIEADRGDFWVTRRLCAWSSSVQHPRLSLCPTHMRTGRLVHQSNSSLMLINQPPLWESSKIPKPSEAYLVTPKQMQNSTFSLGYSGCVISKYFFERTKGGLKLIYHLNTQNSKLNLKL